MTFKQEEYKDLTTTIDIERPLEKDRTLVRKSTNTGSETFTFNTLVTGKTYRLEVSGTPRVFGNYNIYITIRGNSLAEELNGLEYMVPQYFRTYGTTDSIGSANFVFTFKAAGPTLTVIYHVSSSNTSHTRWDIISGNSDRTKTICLTELQYTAHVDGF